MNMTSLVGFIIATLDALIRKGSGSNDTSDAESSINSTFSFLVPSSSIIHFRLFIDIAMVYLLKIKKPFITTTVSRNRHKGLPHIRSAGLNYSFTKKYTPSKIPLSSVFMKR
jgi:hypothetical protein